MPDLVRIAGVVPGETLASTRGQKRRTAPARRRDVEPPDHLGVDEILDGAMSGQNMEVVHQLYGATRRGDLDAFLALHDPDAKLVPLILDVEGGGYQGHAGVRRFWSEIHSAFPDWHWEAEQIRVFDQEALVTVRICGRGRDSSVTIDQRAWHALKFRSGKVAWWQVFRSEGEALEALGLRRKDVKPAE